MLRAAHHSAGMRGRLIEAHRLAILNIGLTHSAVSRERRAGDVRTETVSAVARALTKWGAVPAEPATATLYYHIAALVGCSVSTVDKAIRLMVRALGGKDADT